MTISTDRELANPFATTLTALDRAHDLARDYLLGLADRPVARAVTAEMMASALDEALPEDGGDPAETVAEWFIRAEPGIVASSGPRFFGFVLGGVTPAAVAGDWLASVIDQNASLWLSSPAAAQTEWTVLRWLKELFGLPADWVGGLTTGATMANFVGLAAGRQWVGKRLGFDPAADGLGGHPPIPVVSSTEIHASAKKALGMLGLGRASVRLVAAPGGRVDLQALRGELSGIDGPVIVVANAGEVNTGAFEDLAAVADLCAAHPGGSWMHVDGAFGLFAAASPRYAHLTRGIERADSVASDAHKWLNVPYDCGFALVRDGEALRGAFAASGDYIAPAGGLDLHVHVPEMSRRFRALSVWCALKAMGRSGYREMVERCCANAHQFASWIETAPNVELMAPVPLNIVCFRYRVDGLTDAETDALNRAAVTALQADGRAFVTGTVWRGQAAIRAAFDNWATTERDVAILEEAVAAIGAALLPSRD
jgi:glutamate/tyrosine decarboxylase-like PLP-dependent enzyme